MRRYVPIAAALIVLLSIALGLVLWTRSPDEEPPPFPDGVMHVAVDPSYPPFAMTRDDTLTGFDVALAQAIGRQLDVPVQFVPTGVDALIASLTTARADVVISALQPETWRMSDVRYTRSYFDAGLVLVSPGDAPLENMDALPGHALAYEFGSEADAEATRWSRRVRPFGTLPYERPAYALDAVRLNEADAALVGATSAYLYLGDHPGWEAMVNHVTHRRYVAAVRIDRESTFEAIDGALAALHTDGTMASLVEQWLGYNPATVGDRTYE